MEFSFDEKLTKYDIKLGRGNRSAEPRYSLSFGERAYLFSEEPVHAGQEFVVRIDAHDIDTRSHHHFVSERKCFHFVEFGLVVQRPTAKITHLAENPDKPEVKVLLFDFLFETQQGKRGSS